jgi:hypothetical protein
MIFLIQNIKIIEEKIKTWDEIGALLNTDGEYLFITNKMYNRYFIFIFGDASNYLQFNAKC